jgi:hypothetical protein
VHELLLEAFLALVERRHAFRPDVRSSFTLSSIAAALAMFAAIRPALVAGEQLGAARGPKGD